SLIVDWFAIGFDYHVAGFQPILSSRSLRIGITDKCAMGLTNVHRFRQFGRDVLHADSELAANHFALTHDLIHYAARHLAGTCETGFRDCRRSDSRSPYSRR